MHIAEVIREMGVQSQLKLKAAICGAEPWTEKMRLQIEEELGISAHDIYGLSETMGPGVACDCEYHKGLHIWEDYYLPEIVDKEDIEGLQDVIVAGVNAIIQKIDEESAKEMEKVTGGVSFPGLF